MTNLKFGKKPFLYREKHLRLRTVLEAPAKTPPADWDYDKAYKHTFVEHIFGNDQYGDCVMVAIVNQIRRQYWTQFRQELPITDEEVEAAYFKLTGGGDDGLNVADALEAWRTDGITVGGINHKIDAYGLIDPSNLDHREWSQCLLTGIIFGITVYTSMIDDFNSGKAWDTVSGQIEGGHGVYGVSLEQLLTWGKRQFFTQNFLNVACDEAWGIVVAQDPLAKFHINESALETYLNNLKSS